MNALPCPTPFTHKHTTHTHSFSPSPSPSPSLSLSHAPQERAVNSGELWRLVHDVHFGSLHQQACAASRLTQLESEDPSSSSSSSSSPSSSSTPSSGERGGTGEAGRAIAAAHRDAATIKDVLAAHEEQNVRRLVFISRHGGSLPERRLAVQALSNLCVTHAARVAQIAAKDPAAFVRVLQQEGALVSTAQAEKEGGKEGGEGSPLIAHWTRRNASGIAPRMGAAFVVGSIAIHRPECTRAMLEAGALPPLVAILREGSAYEQRNVANMLLIMMKTSEHAWRAAQASALPSLLRARAQDGKGGKGGEGGDGGGSNGAHWLLLDRMLSFEGPHKKLAAHLTSQVAAKVPPP